MGEILFLAHRVPWPPNRGDKIRSQYFLQKLMDCAPVHVGCFADDAAEQQTGWQRKNELASCEIVLRQKPQSQAGVEALFLGKPVSLRSFESPALEAYVADIIAMRPIDCIFVFSGQMAQFIPADFAGRVGSSPRRALVACLRESRCRTGGSEFVCQRGRGQAVPRAIGFVR